MVYTGHVYLIHIADSVTQIRHALFIIEALLANALQFPICAHTHIQSRVIPCANVARVRARIENPGAVPVWRVYAAGCIRQRRTCVLRTYITIIWLIPLPGTLYVKCPICYSHEHWKIAWWSIQGIVRSNVNIIMQEFWHLASTIPVLMQIIKRITAIECWVIIRLLANQEALIIRLKRVTEAVSIIIEITTIAITSYIGVRIANRIVLTLRWETLLQCPIITACLRRAILHPLIIGSSPTYSLSIQIIKIIKSRGTKLIK